MFLTARSFYITIVSTIFTLFIINMFVLYARPRKLQQRNYWPVNQWNTNIVSDNWRNLTPDQIKKLSRLGEILYLGKKAPEPQLTSFKILVWNDVKRMKRRHLKNFTKKEHNPWKNCNVSNCEILFDRQLLPNASAVLFPIQSITNISEFPPVHQKLSQQIWVMLTDESPNHPFLSKPPDFLYNFNGFFNWTMTYRMDSDVPVPYGLTINRKRSKWETLISIPSAMSSVSTVILISNCNKNSYRWKYVMELKKYLPIDILGKCGKDICPGHFRKDCDALENYNFYLAFENSHCTEYITEKVWWNAYHKGLIPVIMGPSKKDCQQLLPPNSYLHVDDYKGPRDLANHIQYLIENMETYLTYFDWTTDYEVISQHAYFKSPSYHFCRLCEALNYNDRPRTYHALEKFWNRATDCRLEPKSVEI